MQLVSTILGIFGASLGKNKIVEVVIMTYLKIPSFVDDTMIVLQLM